MELNLQMARGVRRAGAALIAPLGRRALELLSLTKEEPRHRSWEPWRRRGPHRKPESLLAPRTHSALAVAAVQERSVPRPRCATRLCGEDAYGGPAHAIEAWTHARPRQRAAPPRGTTFGPTLPHAAGARRTTTSQHLWPILK